MAAGAAGDARAADGVAGESSMLPWEDAGLSHGFSAGRYCTHGFLLLDAREPAKDGGERHEQPKPEEGGGWQGDTHSPCRGFAAEPASLAFSSFSCPGKYYEVILWLSATGEPLGAARRKRNGADGA